jgi:acetylornithine deacetylase/succinyl-diaminopimelate desuccinylase-like protein
VIRIDTRPQPGISVEEVRGVIQTSLDRVQAHDPQFQYSLELADFKKPHYIAPEQPVVQQLKVALEAATGRPAAYKAASWLGDTSSFGHLIPTVIFGPGREPVYTANEYLSFGEIATAAQVYAACVAQALAR